jgi:hypothetical protein
VIRMRQHLSASGPGYDSHPGFEGFGHGVQFGFDVTDGLKGNLCHAGLSEMRDLLANLVDRPRKRREAGCRRGRHDSTVDGYVPGQRWGKWNGLPAGGWGASFAR